MAQSSSQSAYVRLILEMGAKVVVIFTTSLMFGCKALVDSVKHLQKAGGSSKWFTRTQSTISPL